MTAPLRGKVARILNSRDMAINIGSRGGVAAGMRFDVIDASGQDIQDPDTGELLGSVERSKVRVEISRVQERFSVASTYRQERVNVGGTGLTGIDSPISQFFMPAKWETRYETLKTEEGTGEDLHERDSYVRVGDPVVQVLDEAGDSTARSAPEALVPSQLGRGVTNRASPSHDRLAPLEHAQFSPTEYRL